MVSSDGAQSSPKPAVHSERQSYEESRIAALKKAVPHDKAFATIDALVTEVRLTQSELSVRNDIVGPGSERHHTGTDYNSLFSINHPLVKTLTYRGMSMVRPGDRIISNVFVGLVVDSWGNPVQEFDGRYLRDPLMFPRAGEDWEASMAYHIRPLNESEKITKFEGRTPEGLSYFVG